MPHQRAAIASVEYLPDFGRAVRVSEFDRPGSSDEVETAQTISYMDELAAADAGQRAIAEAAHDALFEAGLDDSASDLEKACAVFWWLKRNVTYVRTPGTSPLVDQTLITPMALLAMPDPAGDCPQFSMLAKAMFKTLCMPCHFVTIASEREFPDQYSHVYNVVYVDGRLLPFDSSNGPEPGTEFARPFKRRIWPLIDREVCSRKEEATAMYRTAPRPLSMRNVSLYSRLGDDSTDDGSSGGIDWGSIISTGLEDATKVASQYFKTGQQPYYTTNPQGQRVLFNPATGTSQVVTGTGSITAGGSISGNALLIGAAVLVGLLVVSRK